VNAVAGPSWNGSSWAGSMSAPTSTTAVIRATLPTTSNPLANTAARIRRRRSPGETAAAAMRASTGADDEHHELTVRTNIPASPRTSSW